MKPSIVDLICSVSKIIIGTITIALICLNLNEILALEWWIMLITVAMTIFCIAYIALGIDELIEYLIDKILYCIIFKNIEIEPFKEDEK